MSASPILIRPFQPADHPAVEEITYRTGFQGEDLTGRGYFDDRRLFYTIFIAYYTHYEPQHFFVAHHQEEDRVVAFIGGTPDTKAQEARFWKVMPPRIAVRAFLYTSWRYPHTFVNIIGMIRMASVAFNEDEQALQAEYPAHLHINVLPRYQGQGLGARLVCHFEAHMKSLDAPGLHLQTSNHNFKAVPFYRKMGFQVLRETATVPHPLLDDLRFITFGKRLG